MSAAIPPHPHVPSWCGETALYILPLYCLKKLLLKKGQNYAGDANTNGNGSSCFG